MLKIGLVKGAYQKSQRVPVYFPDGTSKKFIAETDITSPKVVVIGDRVFSQDAAIQSLDVTTKLFHSRGNNVIEQVYHFISFYINQGTLTSIYHGRKLQLLGAINFTEFSALNIRYFNYNSFKGYGLSEDETEFIEFNNSGIVRTQTLDADDYAVRLNGDVAWGYIFPRVYPNDQPTVTSGDVTFINLQIPHLNFTYDFTSNSLNFNGKSQEGTYVLTATDGVPGGSTTASATSNFTHNGGYITTINSHLLGDGFTHSDSAAINWSWTITENKDHDWEHSDDSISTDGINRPYYTRSQGSYSEVTNFVNNSNASTDGYIDISLFPRAVQNTTTLNINETREIIHNRTEHYETLEPRIVSNYFTTNKTRIYDNVDYDRSFGTVNATNDGTFSTGTGEDFRQRDARSINTDATPFHNLRHIGLYWERYHDETFINNRNTTSTSMGTEWGTRTLPDQPPPPEYFNSLGQLYISWGIGGFGGQSFGSRTEVRTRNIYTSLFKIAYNDPETIPTEGGQPDISESLIPGYSYSCDIASAKAQLIHEFYNLPEPTPPTMPPEIRSYVGDINVVLDADYFQYQNLVISSSIIDTYSGSTSNRGYDQTFGELHEHDLTNVKFVDQIIFIKTSYLGNIYLTKCQVLEEEFTELVYTPGSNAVGTLRRVEALTVEPLAIYPIKSFFTNDDFFFTQIGVHILSFLSRPRAVGTLTNFDSRVNIIREVVNDAGTLIEVYFAATMLPISEQNTTALIFRWDAASTIEFIGLGEGEVTNFTDSPILPQPFTQYYGELSDITFIR